MTHTGRKNCRDFDSIESRGKRQGYSSLEAFANDVRRCFQNAHAWRTRCDDLVRVGSMDANTLAIAVLIAASWGLSEIIRHRRDSYSSDEAVGGLFSDSERVSGEIATRHISHTGGDHE